MKQRVFGCLIAGLVAFAAPSASGLPLAVGDGNVGRVPQDHLRGSGAAAVGDGACDGVNCMPASGVLSSATGASPGAVRTTAAYSRDVPAVGELQGLAGRNPNGVDAQAFRTISAHDPSGPRAGVVASFSVAALAASVPESVSWTMVFVGVGMMGFALRRRRRVVANVRFV